MFSKLLITLFLVHNSISFAINSSKMNNECRYVTASLPTQINIKNQNNKTRYVMDDMYKRFAKKYHMSTNQIKYCLESKYKNK